jgi:hypothetical protein
MCADDRAELKGSIRFVPGQTVIRRILHPDDRIATLQTARVVSDDERGLLLWIATGSPIMRRTTVDGEPTRHLAYLDELRMATVLQPSRTTMSTLILTPPVRSDRAAHSVTWWFDEHLRHTAWYVNLETPAIRWRGGIDVYDHALDVVVGPDYSWELKDEDEFESRAGQVPFWTAECALAIRAEAMRVMDVVEAKEFPFDGSWCDFEPDAAWSPSSLPRWWDQPSAHHASPWDGDFYAA